MVTVLAIEEPVARKKHRCEWCGERILPGEKHKKFVQIFNGEFQCFRMHYECDHMAEHLSREDPYLYEDGFIPHQHRRGKTHEQIVAARLQGDPEWRY